MFVAAFPVGEHRVLLRVYPALTSQCGAGGQPDPQQHGTGLSRYLLRPFSDLRTLSNWPRSTQRWAPMLCGELPVQMAAVNHSSVCLLVRLGCDPATASRTKPNQGAIRPIRAERIGYPGSNPGNFWCSGFVRFV